MTGKNILTRTVSIPHNVRLIHKGAQVEDNELVGVFEISELARVTPQAVANWRVRFDDFPPPVAVLRSGPVFDRDAVRRWLRRRKVPMANVISFINLKGGVSKSTTSVAMAEFLSAEFHKKVLFIDLDPQTNATTMLIGDSAWKDLNSRDHTLAQLFRDALLEDPSERHFDLEKTLQKKVSDVSEVRTLDLLPSSIDLIDIQDRLATMSSGRFYSEMPTDILRRATRQLLEEYEYVIIDCPPNLGIITLNGIRISLGYVIPTIPDVLSTYGIPQIVSRVGTFSDTIGEAVRPLGIVVSKYRAQSTVHQNTVKELRKGKDAPVFQAVVPESNDIAASAEFHPNGRSTLRQKYGYRGAFETYRGLAKEIMEAAAQ